MISFHERSSGKVSHVSEKTRHCKTRRGVVQPSSTFPPSIPTSSVGGPDISHPSLANCQIMGGDSPSSGSLINSRILVEDVTEEEGISSSAPYTGPVTDMFSSFEPSEVPDLVHNSDDTSTSASVN